MSDMITDLQNAALIRGDEFLKALCRPIRVEYGTGILARPVLPRRCRCARVARYGVMCRKCAWRLLTPPPLTGTPDPVDRHSQAPAHGPCGIAERTYALYSG